MSFRNRTSRESGKAAYPLLSIAAVLVCSAVVFAQSGSGQENGLEHRVSALEAALANMQNPPARVLIASDPDGTAGPLVIYRPTQIHDNTMGDHVSVNATSGLVTVNRAGFYSIYFKASLLNINGIATVSVNGAPVDGSSETSVSAGVTTQCAVRIRLEVGDTVSFLVNDAMDADGDPVYGRVEMEYLGS